MLHMQMSTMTNGLVETLLKGKSNPGKGLLFDFDVQVSTWVEGHPQFLFKRNLNFLYTSPNSGAYISVFSRVAPLYEERDRKKFRFDHICTHDSAWKEVETILNLYSEGAADINRQLLVAGLPTKAPAEMDQYIFYRLFRPAFEWVSVRQTKSEDKSRRFEISIID